MNVKQTWEKEKEKEKEERERKIKDSCGRVDVIEMQV